MKPRLPRVVAMAAVVLLHLAVYYAVNTINGARPVSALRAVRAPLDAAIPYLGWTSAIYYAGTLYALLAGAAVVSHLGPSFGRAIRAYLGLVLCGGVLQVLWPVEAPFPSNLSSAQQLFHAVFQVRPYATFPSMHVALAVLPTAIAVSTFRNRVVWALLVTATVLIAISTVTAKEHFVLDAVFGALLGLASWRYWRWPRGA